ncbi:MAG TPA: GvpL/GvpF family gas vesicle protein [Vicinamibacteria bacterium]|nr:GvpL/GvpF family gas vesicle protein [Vicinamibacteria bacterium]
MAATEGKRPDDPHQEREARTDHPRQAGGATGRGRAGRCPPGPGGQGGPPPSPPAGGREGAHGPHPLRGGLAGPGRGGVGHRGRGLPAHGRVRGGPRQVRVLHRPLREAAQVRADRDRGEPGEVHTVHYKELAAVVSDTPIEVFDATRENVLAHERVNEAVMRKMTVLPMSFGTVFKTHGDIIELLKAAYDAFMDVLNKMQGKVEFGLKVLWERDELLKDIEREDENVSRLKDEISSQKGSTYFARMQYGRLVDAALEQLSERYVNEIFDQLRPVSVASRANKPIGDKMIMNAAFLVTREKEAAFDAKVKEIGARYDKLTFKYTGPWPPYNFVNIRLKLERAREAE